MRTMNRAYWLTGMAVFALVSPAASQTWLLELEKSDATKVMRVDDTGGLVVLGIPTIGALPVTGSATRLMWWPGAAAFRVGHVTGDQWDAGNIGWASAAFGTNTIASGDYSTATGYDATAGGNYSVAVGRNTTASGGASTAMGQSTTASGAHSTAMGYATAAIGDYSTAMGSHTAAGEYSTAMGSHTEASGDYSTVMGVRTRAGAYASVALGRYNVGSAYAPHTWVPTEPVLEVGNGTADADRSNALTLLGNGDLTIAGRFSTGNSAPNGNYSTAMGYQSTAGGEYSTAIGYQTLATGDYTTALGYNAVASGHFATAMGPSSTASGNYSVAMGAPTTSQAHTSVALGRFNVIEGSQTSWIATDPLLVVGNGSSEASRSNALTLLKNGNLTIAGTLTQNSDARLKTDVQSLPTVLAKLHAIRAVTFEWKDKRTHPAGRQLGLLAQEVMGAFPELVHEDSEGNLSVAYGNLTAVLLAAIQEQQREIEALRERLAVLEEEQVAQQ